jgi:environmental stress-induced protein Ves
MEEAQSPRETPSLSLSIAGLQNTQHSRPSKRYTWRNAGGLTKAIASISRSFG